MSEAAELCLKPAVPEPPTVAPSEVSLVGATPKPV